MRSERARVQRASAELSPKLSTGSPQHFFLHSSASRRPARSSWIFSSATAVSCATCEARREAQLDFAFRSQVRRGRRWYATSASRGWLVRTWLLLGQVLRLVI